MGRHIHYSEPVEFHKALPGSVSIPIWKRDDSGIPEGFTPPKRKTQPKVRNARNEPIDDEIGEPAEKGIAMTDYDTSRGPWHAMFDRQARALQAQTGWSYAKCYTECYTDPRNVAIRDASSEYDLAKSYNATFGPVQLAKAAPPDPREDYADRGQAHSALNELVMARMKADPKLSYERAFTNEYTHPDNRSLKDRVDAESAIHAQRLASGKPFPRYSAPGHTGVNAASNVGREGRGGEDF
jgi:hypothetical protein